MAHQGQGGRHLNCQPEIRGSTVTEGGSRGRGTGFRLGHVELEE